MCTRNYIIPSALLSHSHTQLLYLGNIEQARSVGSYIFAVCPINK